MQSRSWPNKSTKILKELSLEILTSPLIYFFKIKKHEKLFLKKKIPKYFFKFILNLIFLRLNLNIYFFKNNGIL